MTYEFQINFPSYLFTFTFNSHSKTVYQLYFKINSYYYQTPFLWLLEDKPGLFFFIYVSNVDPNGFTVVDLVWATVVDNKTQVNSGCRWRLICWLVRRKMLTDFCFIRCSHTHTGNNLGVDPCPVLLQKEDYLSA